MEINSVSKSFLITGIFIVLILDFLGTRAANHIAKKSTKPFEEIALDWGKTGADCYVGRALLVYRYQYCYDVLNWSAEKSEWKASLYYHNPRAIFSFTRVFMSTSYYFNELPYGDRVQIFAYNEGNT